MKKFLYLSVILAFVTGGFSSCNDDDPEEVKTYHLRTESGTIWTNVNADGDSKTISLESNGSWTASVTGDESDWLSVSPAQGRNDGDIVLTAGKNEDEEGREAVVRVVLSEDTSKSLEFTVKQLGQGETPPIGGEEFEVNPGKLSFEYNDTEEVKTVTVTAPSTWSLDYKENDWFAIKQNSGNFTVELTELYYEEEDFVLDIDVLCGEEKKSVVVTLYASSTEVIAPFSSISLPQDKDYVYFNDYTPYLESEAGEVTLRYDIETDARKPESWITHKVEFLLYEADDAELYDEDWVEAELDFSGSTPQLVVKITENQTYSPRAVKIIVESSVPAAVEASDEVVIYQEALPYILSTEFDFYAGQDYFTSSGDVTDRNLSWSGRITYDEDKDIFNMSNFYGNPKYVIPVHTETEMAVEEETEMEYINRLYYLQRNEGIGATHTNGQEIRIDYYKFGYFTRLVWIDAPIMPGGGYMGSVVISTEFETSVYQDPALEKKYMRVSLQSGGNFGIGISLDREIVDHPDYPDDEVTYYPSVYFVLAAGDEIVQYSNGFIFMEPE